MTGFDKFFKALLFGMGVIASLVQTMLLVKEYESFFVIFLCGVATMTFVKYFIVAGKEMLDEKS